MKLQLGIIGHPLGHTLSPQLHTALMEQLGLHGTYEAFDTPPEALADTLKSLREQGVQGLSVTIPHKVMILPELDGLSDEAMLIGAANTVVFKDSGCFGHNTDVAGFLAGLPDLPAETHALVLGAGGAARAVVTGLIQRGVAHIHVVARQPQKAEPAFSALAKAARHRYGGQSELTIGPLDASLADLSPYTLVVNTTPVGMVPHPEHSPLSDAQIAALPHTALVYDLIYRPRVTHLLAMAEARGLRTQDGLAMLIHQGVEAFYQWTGIPAARNPELPAKLLSVLQQAVNPPTG